MLAWWLGSAVRSRFHPFAIGALLVASHAFGSEPPARERAKALLAELDKQGAARGAARDAVAEPRRALGRADKARLAGDQKHGAELESSLSNGPKRAATSRARQPRNARATELEKKLTEAEAKLRTTRTLIEQAAARRARADAELAELENPRSPRLRESPKKLRRRRPRRSPEPRPPRRRRPRRRARLRRKRRRPQRQRKRHRPRPGAGSGEAEGAKVTLARFAARRRRARFARSRLRRSTASARAHAPSTRRARAPR